MTNEQVYATLKSLIQREGITPEQIRLAVDQYIEENGLPITPVTEVKINQIVDNRIDAISVINCTAEEK